MKKRLEMPSRGVAVSDSSAADWSRVPPRGHGVQFYNSDDQLLRLLTRYVGTALVGGDVAVLVTTRSHRVELERRLAARGLDLAIARAEHRYVTEDAEALLDQSLTGGHLDLQKARAVIDEVFERASHAARHADEEHDRSRLFVFGEMVAILAARRGPDEAVHLEEVLNDMGGLYSFTLCCGYPMANFTQHDAAPFVRICAQHSHIFHASGERRAVAADRVT